MLNFPFFLRRRRALPFQWGGEHSNRFDETDMALIREYYEKTGSGCIDDITWNDLNMDALFQHINACTSAAGDNFLYAALRSPLLDADAIRSRDQRIRRVSDPALRASLISACAKLGRDWRLNWAFFLGQTDAPSKMRLILHLFLVVMLVVSLLLCIFGIPSGIVFLMISLLANPTAAVFAQKRVHRNALTIRWTFALLRTARRIHNLAPDLMSNELLHPLRKFRAGNLMSAIYDDGIPAMFARFFLQSDAILYERYLFELPKYTAPLKALMDAVGEIDALIAIGNWRAGQQEWCVPEFSDQADIELHALRHPLIANCVPNSLTISGPILLTGSNASGKSTFLRAVALCAILAQSLATCPAVRYRARPCIVMSSMSLRDDVLSGASYFMAEVRSVMRILEYKGAVPCLAFVDEVLRGTNTGERISAACAVLSHLASNNITCLAATHDGELTELLADRYTNYHFSEIFENGAMRFDYTLRPGASRSFNALRLIESLGGNADMLQHARKLWHTYQETGQWENA